MDILMMDRRGGVCLASPLWFIGPDLAEGERVEVKCNNEIRGLLL